MQADSQGSLWKTFSATEMMMSSSGFGTSINAVLPASTPLTRRLGHHQYERAVPVATAGMFDWKVKSYSNRPIHSGKNW